MSEEPSIKLICFDIDGTLIDRNSWHTLNVAMGMTPEEDRGMYDLYIAGNLPYNEWLGHLSAFYRQNGKATKENVERVLFEYELKDGVKETISHLKNKEYKVAVITGSFDMLARNVSQKLNLDAYKGNSKIIFDDEENFEEIETEGDETQNKPPHLMEICNSLRVAPNQCICVGDGINDVEVFKFAGKGIAFNNSPSELKELAWKTIDSISELQEIL